MFKRLCNRLRRFRREDEGSILAEAVIMFPTLFAAMLATFVFFDAFRNQSVNLKANYTIADSISRQSNFITNTYMVNMWNLHRFLTDSNHLTRLRVSIIKYDADKEEHSVVWSRAKGGGDNYDHVPITTIGLNASEIPLMPNNEVLIVVQTEVIYEPNFSIGFGAFAFVNTTYTRHRWSPNNVCYRNTETSGTMYCSGHSA
ncbi:TadE/TadG family type IV pilus assembly protein [Thalassorhabdomicrobium marinisediminis]|uniref:TadE/TadG family type IV pilus assembly protein n=1 Tax=Thalassorhabdomicrobium marinisediminis TaxID=2170577 RepID=UPI00248F6198|nr:hypothetical protein [Thalassorhabdomicrobium marinisediminis]